jgi:hypothetical protein
MSIHPQVMTPTRKHLYKLFDLEVKGQGNNVVMMVHDIPSDDYKVFLYLSNNCFAFLDRLMIFGMWLYNHEVKYFT